ncbi:MAG: alanine racemase, partial [Blautia sp.]|nr:alanine racemase [Blautia sp.]
MKMHSRIQAEIDLDAMTYNLEHIKKNLAPKTQVIAVLKADGYGHGAVPLARRIQKDPEIWGIAVATVEEGEELRNAGITKPILILGYTYQEDYQKIAKLDFRPAVFKLSMAKELSKAALEAGKTLKIHIKIDTGMTRIGYRDVKKDVPEILAISKLPGLEIEGIFTHFARADEADKTPALVQYEKFQEFIRALEQEGLHIPMKHCSNSAGIIRMQEANLDAVRAGIILYGLYPSKEVEREPVPLKPLMSLRSHIAYIKTVEPGVEISYGGIFTTVRETRVATIPVGYADGYPRGLSNKGSVLIRGKRAPILGRVCMDQFMVDVTEIPEAEELDQVTLLGKDGEDCITMEELGELSGRFNYEFACCISKRVPRVYL